MPEVGEPQGLRDQLPLRGSRQDFLGRGAGLAGRKEGLSPRSGFKPCFVGSPGNGGNVLQGVTSAALPLAWGAPQCISDLWRGTMGAQPGLHGRPLRWDPGPRFPLSGRQGSSAPSGCPRGAGAAGQACLLLLSQQVWGRGRAALTQLSCPPLGSTPTLARRGSHWPKAGCTPSSRRATQPPTTQEPCSEHSSLSKDGSCLKQPPRRLLTMLPASKSNT